MSNRTKMTRLIGLGCSPKVAKAIVRSKVNFTNMQECQEASMLFREMDNIKPLKRVQIIVRDWGIPIQFVSFAYYRCQ